MTNREWLESLSDEELSKLMNQTSCCEYCAFGENCTGEGCVEGTIKWLQSEHKEPKKEFTETKLSAAIDLFFSDRRAVSIDELKQMVRGLFE